MLTERRRKEIASLSQKKYRTQLGQTIVEGVRSVSAALRSEADVVEVIVTHESMDQPDVAALLAEARAHVYTVDNRVMHRLTDLETSPGILAVVRTHFEAISELHSRNRVLALDGVQDPGNVGTLIRTAAWFGIDALLVGPGTADPFAPKVVRATMGSLWNVTLAESRSLPDSLQQLRSAAFTVYAAMLDGEDAGGWQGAVPSVLVLGNEAHGISPEVEVAVDGGVTIPGSRRDAATESLNVATAGAVLMYQWTR